MKKVIVLILIFSAQSLFSQQCWKEIASSAYNVLGISANGKLWSWGRNQYGQLGNGNTISSNDMVQISTASNWATISATYNDSFAIKTNGTLWAWGRNNDFNHGDGTNTPKLVPIQIGTANNWLKVAASVGHTLAIKTDGTLWAWGDNGSGKLGDGTLINRTTPVQIGTDNDWKLISCGNVSSVAIKNNGTLWTWGSSGFGLNVPQTYSPIQLGTSTNWKEIQLFYTHLIALKADGTLWARGDNTEGQLGIGSSVNQSTLVQVGTDTDWKTANSGFQFSMAIKNNGTLWGWGENVQGKLGNGTANGGSSLVPIQIGTNTNWKTIDLGYYHASATYSNANNLSSWGWNGHGQLGNGTGTQANTPVFIACPTNLVLSNSDFETTDFKIYPNPANNHLHINSDKIDSIKNIQIIDIMGKTVLTKQSNFEEINLENLPVGFYILTVFSEKDIFNFKFFKN